MDNTARKIESYQQTQYKDQTNDAIEVKQNVETSKVPLSVFEKSLMVGIGIIAMVMMTILVSSKVQMTSSQAQLQNVSQSVSKVSENNNDLKQEVGELSNSKRLLNYAGKHGMKMNDNNVRNVR